jgi:hypothetical protein
MKYKQVKLIISHQNICSLRKKLTELEVLLSTELKRVDVICLTEHWQSDQNKSCTNIGDFKLVSAVVVVTMNVGPCHHGMARPQVADGGTASDMEGSCE